MLNKEEILIKLGRIFSNYTVGNIDGKAELIPNARLWPNFSYIKLEDIPTDTSPAEPETDPIGNFDDALTMARRIGATVRVMSGGTYLVLGNKYILFNGDTKALYICALVIDHLSLPPKSIKRDLKKIIGEKYPAVFDPYSDRETTRETLYSADWHIGHHKVAESRGFSHTEAHDIKVITTSLFRVSKGGTVIIVGDLLFGSVSNFDNALECAVKDLFPRWEVGTKLPFNLRIVLGNHDKIIKLLTSKYIGIECIFAMREVKTKEGRVIISHIPVRGSEFKPEGRFVGNIHGHLHAKKIGGKYYCVSWEQKRGSYTLSELLEKE